MLRFRSLSIKLSVSLFRADKIDLFCYLYFSKFSMSVNVYLQNIICRFNRFVSPLRKRVLPVGRSVENPLLCCFEIDLQFSDFLVLLTNFRVLLLHLRLCKEICHLNANTVQQIYPV